MATLQLKNINKIYPNGVQAVFDFNLEIKDKEFIVFVGPSGCGKTTTLRMIAGLEEISSGDLYIDELLVNDVAPKDRNIAMVFQSYALYPHMTVFDNMAFGLKIRKVPKTEIQTKVMAAAEILGLVPYLKRKPSALSGGQKQRVALGRAIVRQAKVFLMDEPLSNLDAKLRVQMRAELIKLHNRIETTTIYVTHDQIEAMTMASRIVVMKDGYIQQIGAPKEIYDYPTNMFVAGFIGTPPMNFIRGTVDKKGNFNIVNIVVNTRDNVLKLNKVVDIAKENILKLNKDLVSLESRKSILEGEELKKLKLEIENLKQTIKKEDASLLQAEISLKDATTEFEKVVTRETESDKFITIPLDKFELLKANGYIGKEVVLGIRPEDIKDRSGEERSSSSLDINVDVAELLGAETNIYTTIGGSSICASVAARSNVRIGDKLTFELDLSKSHFFDSETEQRIK